MPQTAKMAPPAPANGAAALLAVSKAASLRIVDGVRTPHGRVARQSPPYSSGMQQPVRATAALGKHPRTRQAASSDREQHRAGSLHPDGLTALAALWSPKDAQRCLLRISEWHFARLGKNELVADANADLYGSDGLPGWPKSGQRIQRSPGHTLTRNAPTRGEGEPEFAARLSSTAQLTCTPCTSWSWAVFAYCWKLVTLPSRNVSTWQI